MRCSNIPYDEDHLGRVSTMFVRVSLEWVRWDSHKSCSMESKSNTRSNKSTKSRSEMWYQLQLIHCLSHYRPLCIVTLASTSNALNVQLLLSAKVWKERIVDINLVCHQIHHQPTKNKKQCMVWHSILCFATRSRIDNKLQQPPVDNLMLISDI